MSMFECPRCDYMGNEPRCPKCHVKCECDEDFNDHDEEEEESE